MMVKRRYANTDALGEEWVERRKAADKNKTTASGEPNPLYPRFALEEKVARLEYDMSYVLAQNRILVDQNEMFSAMLQRVAVLEGAYTHLMTSVQSQKLEYYNKLKKVVDNS